MPPKKAKQTASNRSSADAPKPVEPQMQMPPQKSPQKQTGLAGITQAQKQALIDNLQLEVTERARRLRAQYADQASILRSRVEMRVNRIPSGLRKRRMGDLMDELAQKEKPAEPPAPQAISVHRGDEEEQAGKVKRGVKRTSEQMSTAESALPEPEPAEQDLPNPKKRAKPTAAATKPATTTQANTKASRAKNPPTSVLSPKSHNSRTLPRSPIKTEKHPPASPAKPVAAKAGVRTGSRQQGPAARKNAPAATAGRGEEGRSSGVSDSSNGTTIVTKAAPKAKAATGAKKGVAARAGAAVKKAVGQKKENQAPVVPTAAAGRSLRKRG